jgi:pyridoxal phosphate enzyme (YggS family)
MTENPGIAERLADVKKTLKEGVTLIAVSKTKPNELLLEAYAAGQRDFGENYVQELVDKAEALPKDIRWHFIGHLQSNKVKYIAGFVHLVHGIDSVKLLKEVNKQAAKAGRVINCLLQIYIAQEETKFGFSGEECLAFLQSTEFSDLKNIRIQGVMGMASNTANEQQIENEFENLKTVFESVKTVVKDCDTISAGMSGDYRLAMQHGSTMVRIGSTIFGNRV